MLKRDPQIFNSLCELEANLLQEAQSLSMNDYTDLDTRKPELIEYALREFYKEMNREAS